MTQKKPVLVKKGVVIPRTCPLSSHTSTDEAFDIEQIQNPIQRLHRRATELSGISYDAAHAIDEADMGERFNEIVLTNLSEKFYAKVLKDPDDWFRDMFQSPQEDLVFNQCEYFHQRLGGSTFYSQRQGTPNLIRRHSNFEITRRTADKWTDYMAESLEELEVGGEVDKKDCDMFMDHLRFMAYFLVASQEAQVLAVKLGCQDAPPLEFKSEADAKF